MHSPNIKQELMCEKKANEISLIQTQKLFYYEQIIEDLTFENTRIIVRLSKFNEVFKEKESLVELLDKYKEINSK